MGGCCLDLAQILAHEVKPKDGVIGVGVLKGSAIVGIADIANNNCFLDECLIFCRPV